MALLGSWDSDTYRLRSKLVISARNVQTSRRYRRRNMCASSTTPSSIESRSACAIARSDLASRNTISLAKNSSVWSVISWSEARPSSQTAASS